MLSDKTDDFVFVAWFGGFFSDQPQFGNLPLTPTALFHIIPAVETTTFFSLGV